MADKVFFQESKEFQMKVIWPLDAPDNQPGVTDRQIHQKVCDTLTAVIMQLAAEDEKKYHLDLQGKAWRREGIRYDTAEGTLKKNNLTLAIEATDERTKLKVKAHNFVPELLYDKPKNSICLPDIAKSGGYKKHDTKLKREEDLHFSNTKFCASGSLFLKGRQTDVQTLAYFSEYFPGLKRLLKSATPLNSLSHWDEAVFDEMETSWGKNSVSTWMLVNRWNWGSTQLLESELSFKVEKSMDEDWDYVQMQQASRLYLALQKTGVFLAVPPIFFFQNPVSSTNVVVV